jgi:hypothetical protein
MLIVLIYVVSLFMKSSIKLNIHNRCSNVDLISPSCITIGWLECYKPLNDKVYAGDTMNFGFIIDTLYRTSDAALIYKLQKRHMYDSTEIDKSISNTVYILIILDFFNESKRLRADVLLVEHDEGIDWNESHLEKLYSKNVDQFGLSFYSATETWSLDDNVALMTTSEIIDEDFILNITISEVERGNDARMPAHIDPER